MSNIVKSIYWRYRGVNGDGIEAEIYGVLPMNAPDPNNFITYENLTQSIVESWLNSNNDVTRLQTIVSNKIDLKANPTEINLPLP